MTAWKVCLSLPKHICRCIVKEPLIQYYVNMFVSSYSIVKSMNIIDKQIGNFTSKPNMPFCKMFKTTDKFQFWDSKKIS